MNLTSFYIRKYFIIIMEIIKEVIIYEINPHQYSDGKDRRRDIFL